MRAIPYGFLPEHLINSYAIINADVTHPHPKSRAASILIARGVQYLLFHKHDKELIFQKHDKESYPKNKIISYCKQFIKDIDTETYDYLEVIDSFDNHIDKFIIGEAPSTSYCKMIGEQPITSFMTGKPIVGLNSDSMRTAGTALYLVKHCNSAFEGFKRSIEIGGDVDSLAAIVVGMLAILYDIDDLPNFIFENLEDKDKLVEIGEKFNAYLKK